MHAVEQLYCAQHRKTNFPIFNTPVHSKGISPVRHLGGAIETPLIFSKVVSLWHPKKFPVHHHHHHHQDIQLPIQISRMLEDKVEVRSQISLLMRTEPLCTSLKVVHDNRHRHRHRRHRHIQQQRVNNHL
jgi:hypothetical protein